MSVNVAIDFNQCVDRRLVHRSANASVFLTSIRRHPSLLWKLGVQLPRYAAAVGTERQHVPLVYGAEVLRQCGIALTHTGYDIPLEYAFTIQDIDFTWRDGIVAKFPMFGPFEGTATAEVTEHYERRGVTAGLRLRFTLHSPDGPAAEGGGFLRCFTPQQYRTLRRRAPTAQDIELRHDPAPLRDIQKQDDTLLGVLAWNHADPFTFDHPADHIPGISMIQSAVYAAEELTVSPVTGISMKFYRFTEFSPAPMIRAKLRPSGTVGIEILQTDGVTATGICHAGT